MNSKHCSGTWKVHLMEGALFFSIWWYLRKCNAVAKRWPKFVPLFWPHILCHDPKGVPPCPQSTPGFRIGSVSSLTNKILADTKQEEAYKIFKTLGFFLPFSSPALPWRHAGSSLLENVMWPRVLSYPSGSILHPMAAMNQSIQGHNNCPH